MYPQVLSVIQVSFPTRERNAAFGIFGALVGIASIAGPLLGGVITQSNILGLGWRPIFLVNLPVGIAALCVAALQMRESRAPKATELDIPGVLIATAGLFLLAYPLVEGREAGWPPWAFLMLTASVPVLAVFALYVVRRERAGHSPLVEPALFRDRSFVVGVLLAAVFFSGIPSFFLTASIFMQVGLGYSALTTGLTTAPFAVGAFIASATSIRLAPRIGKVVLNVGAALLVAGVLLVGFTIQQVGDGIQGVQLAPALLVAGLGMGLTVAPLVTIVLSGIHHGHAGSASGVLTTIQQVGAALGVAVIGVIFFGLLSNQADQAARAVQPQLRSGLQAAGFPQSRIDPALELFRLCFVARAKEADPTVVPAVCPRSSGAQSPQQARTGQLFAQAAQQARMRDFSDSFRTAILYNVGVFGLTFLLVFLLPRSTPRRPGEAVPAAG
jgi:MFS family permease